MSLSRGIIFDDPRSTLRRTASIPAVRALIAFLTLFSICILYGVTNFYRDPGSVFFNENRAFVRWYSAYRQQQAEAFIDSVADYTQHREQHLFQPVFPRANENASMCVAFLTMSGDAGNQHLETSLGSILEGLTPAERADINIQIFFANTNPSHHPLWYKPWLRRLVDKVYTYADLYSFEGMADVLALEQAGHGTLSKPPLDYVLALQQCVEHTKAQYIALLEDDIIAAEGWFARALWAAREVERKMAEEDRAGMWMYVRLFNQECSTGWVSNRIGKNGEATISLGVAAVVFLFLLVLRQRLRSVSSKSHLDKWTMLVICCVAVPSFVVLFFQAGRASMLPPSPGVKEEGFGCCTQALVFNRDHVPGLVQHIHGQASGGQHDILTSAYSQDRGLARFSLYPVMVQHIGTRFSSQENQGESSKAWSMAFESLNPKRLRHDHLEFVKGLYGSDAAS